MNCVRKEYVLSVKGMLIPGEREQALFHDVECAMREAAEGILLEAVTKK